MSDNEHNFDLHPIFSLSHDDVVDAIERLTIGYKDYFPAATTNKLGCLLAQKATNKRNGQGYVKCKVRGSQYEFYAHHLAIIAAQRSVELFDIFFEAPANAGQLSHLCHSTRCIRADHLIIEPASVNLDRNKCRGHAWVTCPCGCSHTFNPCVHTPKCILPRSSSQH